VSSDSWELYPLLNKDMPSMSTVLSTGMVLKSTHSLNLTGTPVWLTYRPTKTKSLMKQKIVWDNDRADFTLGADSGLQDGPRVGGWGDWAMGETWEMCLPGIQSLEPLPPTTVHPQMETKPGSEASYTQTPPRTAVWGQHLLSVDIKVPKTMSWGVPPVFVGFLGLRHVDGQALI
jgi:hypothetical protein